MGSENENQSVSTIGNQEGKRKWAVKTKEM